MTEDRLKCIDENECINNPCETGNICHNLDNGEGFYCLCPTGYKCHNCSCDVIFRSVEDSAFAFGITALGIALACLATYIFRCCDVVFHNS